MSESVPRPDSHRPDAEAEKIVRSWFGGLVGLVQPAAITATGVASLTGVAAARSGGIWPVVGGLIGGMVDYSLFRNVDRQALLRIAVNKLGPSSALELLADWSRIRRSCEWLIDRLGDAEQALVALGPTLRISNATDLSPRQLFSDVTQLIVAEGKPLAQAAVGWFNSASWMASAQSLSIELDNWGGPTDWELRTRRLLDELDAAQLVSCVGRFLEVTDAAREDELARCEAWVASNPECFLPLSGYVGTLRRLIRPDLLCDEMELAETTVKFDALQSAFEDILADADLQSPPPAGLSQL